MSVIVFPIDPVARTLVVSSEIVLTLGMSRTVESFLKKAAIDRNYTALIAEAAPS